MTASHPRATPRDNIPRYLLPLRLAQLFLALVVLAFGAYGVATIATPGDVLIVTAVRSPLPILLACPLAPNQHNTGNLQQRRLNLPHPRPLLPEDDDQSLDREEEDLLPPRDPRPRRLPRLHLARRVRDADVRGGHHPRADAAVRAAAVRGVGCLGWRCGCGGGDGGVGGVSFSHFFSQSLPRGGCVADKRCVSLLHLISFAIHWRIYRQRGTGGRGPRGRGRRTLGVGSVVFGVASFPPVVMAVEGEGEGGGASDECEEGKEDV